MTIVSIMACVLLGFFLVFMFLRRGDILSPLWVFSVLWIFVVGLTDLKLSSLQHQWDLEGWVYVLLGPISLWIGIFCAKVVNLRHRTLPPEEIRSKLRSQPLREGRLFGLILLGAGLYFAAYALIALVKGYVPMFSPSPAIMRKEFSVFGIGVLVNSMPFLLFFIACYIVLVPGVRGRKAFVGVIGLLAFSSYLLLLQRFQILMAAVMCFALLYYASSVIRWRTLLPFAGTFMGFFYWVSTLRAGQLIQYYLYATSKMKLPARYALLTEPYMYVAMNLENFVRSVKHLEQFTYGYYTFDFMFAFTGLKHWLAEYFMLDETPFLVSGYNTYTAFWTLYRDFGPFGLTIVPLAMGFTIGAVYFSFRRAPTLGGLTAYGAMLFVMAISFFNLPVGFLWFVYNAVFMVVAVRIVKAPERSGPPTGVLILRPGSA